MFLKCSKRRKDGKEHRTWSVVESRRVGRGVVQRHVLYLGEINDAQRAAWQKSIEVFDERFYRMWLFYLAGAATGFEEGDLVNFQLQLVRNRDAVPITRDYIAREEARLRTLEGGHRPPLRLAGE